MQKIAEGKTKIIYKDTKANGRVIVSSKDDITAGDGVKRDILKGKSSYSNITTSNVFKLLNLCGIKTHFHKRLSDSEFSADHCEMIPVEVVTRRIAAGSYIKRNPRVKEGQVFSEVLLEFFIKDDVLHDPIITEEELLDKKIEIGAVFIAGKEIEEIKKTALSVFLILERAWARQNITLVDLKIEFGVSLNGEIILADVIDNDSWRIWPAGKRELMLDKQVYRDCRGTTSGAHADENMMEKIKTNYEIVAKLTENFLETEKSASIIFMGSESDREFAEKIITTLKKFEIEHDVCVLSAHKNTARLLERIKKYDARYKQLVYIAVAGLSNGLGPVTDGNTTNPVINCPKISESFGGMDILSSLRTPNGICSSTVLGAENTAYNAVKILAMNDHILWGKFLVWREKYFNQNK